MELVGKTVKIHLTTPLINIDSHGAIQAIQGKILEKPAGGFLIEIQELLPERKGMSKYPYSTIFIPSHKIDFFGVVS
ncbi:MAG: hypothetical protein IT286_01100 [Proteobacteria bacterium]|jgi:hypothetical protein|nr:hypothetical protein [Pseudomonadota bacterium]